MKNFNSPRFLEWLIIWNGWSMFLAQIATANKQQIKPPWKDFYLSSILEFSMTITSDFPPTSWFFPKGSSILEFSMTITSDFPPTSWFFPKGRPAYLVMADEVTQPLQLVESSHWTLTATGYCRKKFRAVIGHM